MGSRGQGQVAFAAQQSGRRIESDPARAGDIDFSPGMKVGEVGPCALRPLHRIDVGSELDQVARHKTGRETEPPQDLDLKPGAVTARARA